MKKIITCLSIIASCFVLISCASKSATTSTEQYTETTQSVVHQDVKGEIGNK